MSDAPTGTGLPPNLAAALSYALGLLTGVAFLILEREDRFVRFHAAQSVVLSIVVIAAAFVMSIVTTVLVFLPFIGPLLSLTTAWLFSASLFVLWLFLMYKAFQGEEWEFPVVGEHARRLLATASGAGA